MARLVDVCGALVWIAMLAGIAGGERHIWSVSTRLESPFVMLKAGVENSKNVPSTEKYEGLFIDLVVKIAEIVDVDLVIKLAPDERVGNSLVNGTYTGMISELVRGRVDLAGPMISSSLLNRVVGTSQPIASSGIAIVAKRPTRSKSESSNVDADVMLYLNKMMMFVDPFTWIVWAALLGSFIVTAILMYVLRRCVPSKPPNSACADAFWWTFRAVATEDNGPRTTPIAMRIVSVTWICFLLLTILVYVAILSQQIPAVLHRSSELVNERPVMPFESPADLVAQTKVRYGVVDGGHAHRFLAYSDVPVYEKMYQAISQSPAGVSVSTASGIQRVRQSDGNFAFIVDSHLQAEYELGKQPCDIVQVGDLLTSNGLVIATRIQSTNRERINQAILQLTESGTLSDLVASWIMNQCPQEEQFDTSSKSDVTPEVPAIDIDGMIGPFILLASGYVISMFAGCVACCQNKRGKFQMTDNENQIEMR